VNVAATFELDYGRGTFTTSVFQLLQWKHALRLEAKGLTMSRGKVSTHLRKLMGLKRTATVEYLSEWVESVLAQLTEEAA
jgi:hypothetical protein